jgi:hypothetical protein
MRRDAFAAEVASAVGAAGDGLPVLVVKTALKSEARHRFIGSGWCIAAEGARCRGQFGTSKES